MGLGLELGLVLGLVLWGDRTVRLELVVTRAGKGGRQILVRPRMMRRSGG